MTRRIFVSAAHTGLAAVTTKVVGRAARPSSRRSTSARSGRPRTAGSRSTSSAGPELAVVGPGDVVGFDQGAVLRMHTRAGLGRRGRQLPGTLDLTDARLPWLLNLPGMGDRPWLTLVVLRDDEGDLTPGQSVAAGERARAPHCPTRPTWPAGRTWRRGSRTARTSRP